MTGLVSFLESTKERLPPPPLWCFGLALVFITTQLLCLSSQSSPFPIFYNGKPYGRRKEGDACCMTSGGTLILKPCPSILGKDQRCSNRDLEERRKSI